MGLNGLRGLYEQTCARYGKKAMATEHLVMFVEEANGARYLYDPESKEVLFYSFDHYFNHITILPDQPEFTFYTLNGIRTFTDYVETLAQQWLDLVDCQP